MYQRNEVENRVSLYREYIKELRQYAPDWLDEENDPIWEKTTIEYLSDPFSDWIPICADEKEVGFFIVCKRGGDCHPDAEYTISQAYIQKKYRRRGLMANAVVSYILNHTKGIYCYDVLKGNVSADDFWRILFTEKVRSTRVYLPEVRGKMERKYLNLYGYRVI